MNIDILKQDGKLLVQNMQCDCGYLHNVPDMDIYITRGIIDGCPDMIASRGLGKSALIVADKNTYDIAAGSIEKRLAGAGYSCRVCVLPGNKVDPTPEMTELVTSAAGDAGFLLGVGSGVITDVTRRAAYFAGLPYAVFGTAASMDAYTSVTSSMLESGVKVSRQGRAAKLLMFDPAVLASAPMLMQAGGVGDMYAKYNVLVDWKLGSVVSGEQFCPLCAKLLNTALETCSSNIDGITLRTEKGMEALITSLILAGLTMLIVGSTRPCSSVEHNIAHYFEMSHYAYGTPAPSHGICAGIGLVYSLMFHDMLKNVDITKIDKDMIKNSRMTREQKEAFLRSYFPPGVGKDVVSANEYWYLEWPEQERRIDKIAAYHEQYKNDCAILPDYMSVAKTLERFGAPSSATKAGISMEMLERMLLCAKDFRSRYSCATALGELGVIEESVKQILEIEEAL